MRKNFKEIVTVILIILLISNTVASSICFASASEQNTPDTIAVNSMEPEHMKTKPENGSVSGNPFKKDMAGSKSYRIPSMVTLDSGRIVAAADMRWNTTYDGGGLDTMVSYSDDKGENWNYTIANYFGDNGNRYNGKESTCFIDPCLVTDGSTIWMMTDVTPYGIATNGQKDDVPGRSVTGFDSNGNLLLSNDEHASYNYYLNMQDKKIYSNSGVEVTEYTVDNFFNIFGPDTNSNLFFKTSPFKVQRTSYLYLVKSTDGGETWSFPSLINLKKTGENGLYVAPGRGIYTKDKIIVIPCYGFDTTGVEHTCFIYSIDKGETWKRSKDLWTGTGVEFNTSESAVVELPEGRLRFFYRDRRTNIKMRYADAIPLGEDDMRTYQWTKEVETNNLINVDCQMSAITYSETINGKQAILISCPTGPYRQGSHDNNGGAGGARKNGSIFVGLIDHEDPDYAIEWLEDMHVNENEAQYMYSCLTEMKDGNIALLYEDEQNGWGTSDSSHSHFFSIAYRRYKITDIVKNATINNNRLEEALKNGKKHVKGQYTEESFGNLEDAIKNADVAKQGIYDKFLWEDYANRIENAINELKKPEDTPKLDTVKEDNSKNDTLTGENTEKDSVKTDNTGSGSIINDNTTSEDIGEKDTESNKSENSNKINIMVLITAQQMKMSKISVIELIPQSTIMWLMLAKRSCD